jgi:NAD(P)-dependent dehydrogenase (short-subunit alcohol dehydrogenase family)
MTWALITGAGQRLGRAVALELARHGWGVAIHYRNSADEAEAVAKAAREAGGKAVTVAADLDDAAARSTLIAHATQKAGAPLTALVNCAAMFEHDTIDTATEAALQRHIALNTFTPALLTMRALQSSTSSISSSPARIRTTSPTRFQNTRSPAPPNCSRALWRRACA